MTTTMVVVKLVSIASPPPRLVCVCVCVCVCAVLVAHSHRQLEMRDGFSPLGRVSATVPGCCTRIFGAPKLHGMAWVGRPGSCARSVVVQLVLQDCPVHHAGETDGSELFSNSKIAPVALAGVHLITSPGTAQHSTHRGWNLGIHPLDLSSLTMEPMNEWYLPWVREHGIPMARNGFIAWSPRLELAMYIPATLAVRVRLGFRFHSVVRIVN